MEHLLQAMSDAGWKPTVVDLGQQYYDESLPGKPGTDGALVLTNTVPFEEADRSPALQVYLKWLKRASPQTPPTTLGVQAFSAGLLFAQAAAAAGSDLTRNNLIDELKQIKHWDGGGLQAPADPGDNQGLRCFLYMQVRGNKFVRYWPKSPTNGTNGFDCAPGNSLKHDQDLRDAADGVRMISEFLRYTVFGLAFAGVYFIAASGLVVTYTASGIFNFAHGAVAMIAAFTYWDLRVEHHWAAPAAFAAVLLVEAPLMGLVIERVVMRNLGGAATITNIVVTIGLLVTLLGVGSVVWAPTKFAATPSLPRFYGANVVNIAGAPIPWHYFIVLAISAGVAFGLWALLAGTRLGIAMRAVVDDRNLARPQRRESQHCVRGELDRRLHARRAGRHPASRRSSRSTSRA